MMKNVILVFVAFLSLSTNAQDFSLATTGTILKIDQGFLYAGLAGVSMTHNRITFEFQGVVNSKNLKGMRISASNTFYRRKLGPKLGFGVGIVGEGMFLWKPSGKAVTSQAVAVGCGLKYQLPANLSVNLKTAHGAQLQNDKIFYTGRLLLSVSLKI